MTMNPMKKAEKAWAKIAWTRKSSQSNKRKKEEKTEVSMEKENQAWQHMAKGRECVGEEGMERAS